MRLKTKGVKIKKEGVKQNVTVADVVAEGEKVPKCPRNNFEEKEKQRGSKVEEKAQECLCETVK